jgi:arsenate reductase
MSKKRVLFLCTGNSARSQMAEGFLRHLAGDKFEVYSAGIKPTEVNPLAIKVMDEVGIDISGQKAKSVTEFISQKFDYVITVCDNAKQTCPVFPAKHKKIHWSLEDPAGIEGEEETKLKVFREIRNKIKENIIKFLNLAKDKAKLKCPFCSFVQEVDIPKNMCLSFYICKSCQKRITPSLGSCCVICAYSDKTCLGFTV